ncbi:MAG: glutamate--tRNA ligase [Planctomycetota bacterium]|jgi:glutamyl-tRNA synthetase
MSVRVRFAPSPTGYLHIGGARTALYNFLFARREKGTMILRVEDTDRQRSTEESLKTIVDGLAWLGIGHDEGPFFQGERLDLYRAAAERLEKSGAAYWQDDPGKGRALYFRMPRDRKVEWEDFIVGHVSIDPATDDAFRRDLVILKADGFPTYNFACVVDDHDMKMTHVIRGQEHLANTPKQIMLYRALGAEPPAFAHIPLIHDPKGAKISKRREYDFPVTVGEVMEAGYIPEVFVNFLALLGWSPGGDLETMSPDEMIRLFSLDRVSKASARFLRDKLDHMNGAHIRARSLDDLVGLCRPHLEKAFDLSGVAEETVREAVRQQQPRLVTLREIAAKTEFVFAPAVAIDGKAFAKAFKKEIGWALLEDVKTALAGMADFTPGAIEQALKDVCETQGAKFGSVAQPVRLAMTGTLASPPIHETVFVVGRERAIARIDALLKRRGSA